MCLQQQLVGQPLTLGCNHSSTWSAKVVECSKPSTDFFVDLPCKTHMCARSSKWSANPRPGSETSLLAEGLQTCVSANPWPLGATLTCFILHHTCGCSQQQLVGQTFQNDQNLEMAYSARHMCVLRAASGRDPIGLPRNTHVYAQSSNWSANPWSWGATLNCLTPQHTCVLTAAIGRPTLN